jgi:hypothetical protein
LADPENPNPEMNMANQAEIDRLEKLLNSEDGTPVHITPEGKVVPLDANGQAETPLADHIARAVELMERGPRMRLDMLPDDPSMLMSSFGPNVTKEIARRLRLLMSVQLS